MYRLSHTTELFITKGIWTLFRCTEDQATAIYEALLSDALNEIEFDALLAQIYFVSKLDYDCHFLLRYAKGEKFIMSIEKILTIITESNISSEVQFIRYDESLFITVYHPQTRQLLGTVMKPSFDANIGFFVRATIKNSTDKSQIFRLNNPNNIKISEVIQFDE